MRRPHATGIAAMRVILVTGMSGSGKSIALHVLEDAGYAVVDNLPARFLLDVIGDLDTRAVKRAAVSIDVRAGVEAVYELPSLLPALRARGHDVQLLFLTADNATLVQRYSETRRRHPLSAQEWQSEPASDSRGLDESIDEERKPAASARGRRLPDRHDAPAGPGAAPVGSRLHRQRARRTDAVVRIVRVQAGRAGRRGPGVRRALPAESVLRADPQGADRHGPAR